MSNYTNKHDKLTAHLDSLYKKHRELDEKIKKEFDKFAPDSIIKPLKTQQLDLKTEITRLEEQLNEA